VSGVNIRKRFLLTVNIFPPTTQPTPAHTTDDTRVGEKYNPLNVAKDPLIVAEWWQEVRGN
jgi:hypothetical protein